MAPDDLLTREEVLGGLPARRARVVLFLIERQTAHMVARSGQLGELLPGERAARERDLAFVQAFAMGREAPVRLTIPSLERYPTQWAHLVRTIQRSGRASPDCSARNTRSRPPRSPASEACSGWISPPCARRTRVLTAGRSRRSTPSGRRGATARDGTGPRSAADSACRLPSCT